MKDAVGLEGLLIQPVQRIPRYIMLLEELYRKTPDDHVDKQSLFDAKMALETVMIKLDHDITAQDLREKFLNMSSKFKGADVC